MKKLNFVLSVLLMCLCFTNVKAQATNDNALEGKARGAAHECLDAYHSGIYEISSSTEVTGICFVEGFTYRVSFYAGPKCNGTGPCPAFPTVLVATVDFGCEGEVFAVTCY
jgi:hypothetical protein